MVNIHTDHDRGLPPDGARPPGSIERRLLDFAPVFRNRTALGYIFGHGANCFELYALRTWIVAFCAFVATRNGGTALLEPMTVSVIAAVLAMPSSVIGNEAAIRFGRQRAIVAFMYVAGLVAALLGLAVSASPAPLLGAKLGDLAGQPKDMVQRANAYIGLVAPIALGPIKGS